MVSRCFTPALAGVVLALCSAPAFAQSPSASVPPPAPPTVTVAVLGLEAIDVPDTIAVELTEALRRKVTATPGFRLITGKDLVEIKLVFACSDESPACMAQAGSTLGAGKLIFGNVRKVGGDYMITLKSVDAVRSVVEGALSDTIPIKRAEPTAFAARTSRWIAKLTGRETTGSVSVRANVTGAAITLDGVAVGLTDSLPVTVADVVPGHHQLVAEKQGYAPAKQDFTLAAGEILPLGIALAPVAASSVLPPEPVIVRQPSDDAASAGGGQLNLARVGFWTALVGAATSAALALKFGYDVKSINKDLDALRRYDCGDRSPSGLCGKDGAPADPLTLSQRTQAASKTDDGNRAQTLQWVFVGLIPPFAIAGGYLLYKGYLDTESNGSSTSASKGL
ncbi:MAG TPA: PEGA domain-containing protein, partial [Polyangia bacterium]|nr:PEGA domain-containing protein [Polyangia bacterium]